MSVQFFTVREVAERLGISAWLVYEHCKKGRIAFYQFGATQRSIRISEEHLEEFINSRERASESVVRNRKKPPAPLEHLKLKRK